ncbi:YARHG domain-containing protein [Flavobacterium sp. JLP]|uniref:YARHG domain-containing protein n=1 Tax=unclassified Flavobacterium TaxID=196869 RepID=UPI00188A8E8E|nr:MULTISPECIES: YARHG domain-containing protein [unclassified Flavobacterium]MBF4493544.1 YARHG domain-containing protein [Flavobacterium sp. MR2016-29]MBF4508059.1 YARHG domain-containing protein [Flavobacterium sp. JLP]
MRNLFYLLLPVILFSCNSKEKKTAKDNADNVAAKEIRTDLYGSWVGDFTVLERDTTKPEKENYSNKINIIIKKITESKVTAQSVVAGNNRPLSGTMTITGNTVHFILKEPGDDKNDGVFDFEIKNDSLLIGTWVANNAKKEVTKRKFELYKKDFKYDPNVMLPEDESYIDYENPKEQEVTSSEDEVEDSESKEDYTYVSTVYRAASESILTLNSSTKKLKESDLKNLKKIDLEILRNTIFARHGFSFKTKTVRQFFDSVEWYIPVSTNVDNQLTAVEKENIAILKRFEKYAEDNYDSFGR